MKKIIFTLIICLTAIAFGMTTWNGSNGIYQIDTGLDAGTETAGYWFIYGDDADGGASKITWPVEPGNEYSTTALDPIIDYCSGVCGDYSLNKGTLDYNPFVGIGFNVAGEDEDGKPAPADASAWNGICISYSVDAPALLEMGLGDAEDAVIGYDNPNVTLPKSATGTNKFFTWSQFKQAGWGTDKITGTEAAKKLVSIKFKIQGATGTTGHFNIMEVGEYGKCTGGTLNAINKHTGMNNAVKIVNNTVILNNTEMVSVVSLTGEVVKQAITKTMNLTDLNPGIYFIKTSTGMQKVTVK